MKPYPETTFSPAVYATPLVQALTPAQSPPDVGDDVGAAEEVDEDLELLLLLDLETDEDDEDVGAPAAPEQALTVRK